jgi:multiple sugar transport system substrate-binding protein/raffinose/stachyose/melibiose transport system substrate-binding protein
MKKLTVLAAAFAAGALLLAGCGSAAEPSQSAPASTEASNTGGDTGGETGGTGAVEITWSFWIGGAEDQQVWDEIGAMVTEANPNITMKLLGAPFSDYWTKLPTQLSSADAQCVVGMQNLKLAEYTDQLLALDDIIAQKGFDLTQIDTGAVDGMRVDGTLYALPYDNGPMILFYNKDVFDQAGVTVAQGWSADDFEAAAKKIKEAAGLPTLGNAAHDMYTSSLDYAYNGAYPWGEGGKINVNNDQLAAAWEWQARLAKDGLALPAISGDADAARASFQTGEVATFVGGPWDVIDLAGSVSFTMGLATLPAGPGGGKTLSAGSGFGINKNCANVDAAFEAISVLTGEQADKKLADLGRAFVARPAAQAGWYEKVQNVVDAKAALDAASASSAPFPSSPDAAKFSELYTQYAAAALNGDRPAKDVLAEIQEQLG